MTVYDNLTAIPAGVATGRQSVFIGVVSAILMFLIFYVLTLSCGVLAKKGAIPISAGILAGVAPGDRLFFGRYPQNRPYEPEPVLWRVLNVKEGKAYMLAEELLDNRIFDKHTSEWKDSELRKWMNGEFLNKVFAPEEQARLVEIHGDKVLCPSKTEILKYTDEITEKRNGEEGEEYIVYPDRLAYPTELAVSRGAYADPETGTGLWWLRTSGQTINYEYDANDPNLFDDRIWQIFLTEHRDFSYQKQEEKTIFTKLIVGRKGEIEQKNPGFTGICVRPVIALTLPDAEPQ